MNTKNMQDIVAHLKNSGFVFQGSEIYGGLSNTWDYGPLGALLKDKIANEWKKNFIYKEKNNYFIDSKILLNPKVWQTSGHVSNFNDPLIENKVNNKRYRADKVIAELYEDVNVDAMTFDKMQEFLVNNVFEYDGDKCQWGPIRKFNLMFETQQGVVEDSKSTIYLRPETAQGIFINFKNVQRSMRVKVPFGIGQIGKSFRNEVTPGNFIFRTREFEQMELEYFTTPGTELDVFKNFKQYCMKFLIDLNVNKDLLRFNDHKKEALSHYSNATTDIQFKFPWGFDELWGIASRTNFDLSRHQEHSGVDMLYLDPRTNEKYIPYVIEPSVGVERLVLTFLLNGLITENISDTDTRDVLKIHPFLAPYKAAILPLNKKDLSEKSHEIYQLLSKRFDVTYDETQTIGKRYRRQDMIGTPYCITVDYDTLNDNSVTIRFRDTMEQIRVKIQDLEKFFIDKIIF